MTFPACDVRLLHNIVTHLERNKLRVYRPGTHRYAAALILRFTPQHARITHSLQRLLVAHNDTMSSSSCPVTLIETLQWMSEHVDEKGGEEHTPSALELLFVKRRMEITTVGRWGGRVSLPGGPREGDDGDVDDMHTLQRELRLCFGVALSETRSALLLGRMPDLVLPSYHSLSLRTLFTSKSISGAYDSVPSYMAHATQHTSSHLGEERSGTVVQSRFVYLLLDDRWTPVIQPTALHQVDCVQWLSLGPLLQPQNNNTMSKKKSLVRDVVHVPVSQYIQATRPDTRWLVNGPLRRALLSFPSVQLPYNAHTTTNSTAEHEDKCEGNNDSETWRVWGMSLRSLSELVQYGGYAALDWPLLSSPTLWLRLTLLYPLHGYYELRYQYYKLRGWRQRWRYRRSCRNDTIINGTCSVHADSSSQYSQQYNRYDARQIVLPAAASPLLYAVPERADWRHVVCFCAVCALLVDALYELACVVANTATLLSMAFDVDVQPAVRRQEFVQYMRDYMTRLGLIAANDKQTDSTTSDTTPLSNTEEDDEGEDDSDATNATPLPEWDYAHEVKDTMRRYL